MSKTAEEPFNYRMERINRLLCELQHEVTRGMMEGEVDESLGFRFYVPISKQIPDGVVHCIFETRPILRYMIHPDDFTPKLKVVE